MQRHIGVKLSEYGSSRNRRIAREEIQSRYWQVVGFYALFRTQLSLYIHRLVGTSKFHPSVILTNFTSLGFESTRFKKLGSAYIPSQLVDKRDSGFNFRHVPKRASKSQPKVPKFNPCPNQTKFTVLTSTKIREEGGTPHIRPVL